jgi:hypothetical protein
MNRLLSVFAPELPTLPLSNATYIQSSPFAENALNLLTASGVDRHSSGRNTQQRPRVTEIGDVPIVKTSSE